MTMHSYQIRGSVDDQPQVKIHKHSSEEFDPSSSSNSDNQYDSVSEEELLDPADDSARPPKKSWSERKSALKFQRRESRISNVASDGEGPSVKSRSRTSSVVSGNSRKRSSSSKEKQRSHSRDHSRSEISKQDEGMPFFEPLSVDEPADLTLHSGKILEYSPQNQYGRFNILLGEGAYKKVYLAYDTKNGFEVAWNVIKMKNVTAQLQMRIIHEMKMLNTLAHESILKFHTCWRSKATNSLCFITEVMHSGTLSDFVQSRPVRMRIMKRWCRHILSALRYLHEEHETAIIHRDLKLDNIFVNGSSGEIRIGDLGLASWERIGNAKSVLGTPEYIAPEMYNESYDEKVDIYAFGLCALEMISKQIPYRECTNAPQIYRKVVNGEPPKAFTKLKDSVVKEFISCCIAPPENWKSEENPSGRPSAGQLLKHDFLSGKRTEEEEDQLCEDFLEDLTDDEIKQKEALAASNQSHKMPLSSISSDRSSSEDQLDIASKMVTNPTITLNKSEDSLKSLASKEQEYQKILSEMEDESTGMLTSTKTFTQLPIEVGPPKSDGILKESEQKDEEKQQKQVGFGTSEVQVIDTAAPPVKISKDTGTTVPDSNEESDTKTYFRWMIQAKSLQKEYLVSETGQLLFEPVITIECQTDESSGDFKFDTSSAKDAGITHLIRQALMLEESEFEQLLENIQSIRRQYESFKTRLQSNYDKDRVIPTRTFRYGTFNSNQKPPQDCIRVEETKIAPETVVVPEPEVVAETVQIQQQNEVEVQTDSQETNAVDIAFQPVEPISLLRQNTIVLEPTQVENPREVDAIERVASPLTPLVGQVEDNPSSFPFINESNEKHHRLEALEMLHEIEQKLTTFIPAFTENKTYPGRGREMLLIAKSFLEFLQDENLATMENPAIKLSPKAEPGSSTSCNLPLPLVKTSSSQSLPAQSDPKPDIDPSSVEDLLNKLATPPPNPNELKTLDPPVVVLRKQSTADLSQNSDNSTSVHTAVNSTPSLLETMTDGFRSKDGSSVDNLITPEKETNFDSLFPSDNK